MQTFFIISQKEKIIMPVRVILTHILKQIMLLLGSVIVVSKSKTLTVLSVAIALVSILIVMLNTL